SKRAKAVPKSTTMISGLQVASIIDGDETIKACAATGGTGVLVSDEQVYDCQQLLAAREGIYAEPAGAVALAGLRRALENGEIQPNEKAVCIITGSGFKDAASTDEMIKNNPVSYLNSVGEMEKYLG
ncbi:MAG TPA: pyridoxal-phosphate dependent enzyme, partial [Cyclobacteriaceae bacterium]|nr:pyridoxal-phosphate dependent enzyme [Cyclobacteriaceae bacterium]